MLHSVSKVSWLRPQHFLTGGDAARLVTLMSFTGRPPPPFQLAMKVWPEWAVTLMIPLNAAGYESLWSADVAESLA